MPDGDVNSFGLTASAAKKIAALAAAETPGARLRITVSGGGCSGFKYDFGFDAAVNGDDLVVERDGAGVVIDEVSLEMVRGSELDWTSDLIGACFQVRNPNAKSKCGCGSSFSV